ncbi:DUF262 domain-containing protein [Chloroflexota bacterium]
MATYSRQIFTVAKLIRWFEEGELVLQPKFQRRLAWKPEARAYLIDTVLRGLPMPKVYLRRTFYKEKERNVYEVVDGQQRLDAILSFRKNELRLISRLSPEYGDIIFDDLADNLQRRFLNYDISAEIMEDASDKEVWGMFERLNTYTLTLNRQEIRNARYFGYFKQTTYRLAAEQTELESWYKLRLFSNQQIARMREVELTSDVLTAIVIGIQDITHITKAYDKFNDQFPKQQIASETFRNTMSFIVQKLPSVIKSTRFRNLAWFYSLAVAVADALYGIPNGCGPTEVQLEIEIANRMRFLHDALKLAEPPQGLARLKEALSRGTSHIPQRKIRHDFFFEMLTLQSSLWHDRWAQLSG